MSSGEESNREEELTIVNLENVKRISETYKPSKGKGKNKKGTIPKAVVQEIWKDRLSPRFYSRLMSVMFPEDSNEVSFLSFYTIYKNLAEPETEIMFRALTIYHIATIHEPPFNYEQANEYPNAPYKAIKDYVCDVIASYLHAIIHFNMKEALAWLDLRASNTLIDGNLVASYLLKDLETHRNEVSIGSLEIWLEKNEIYYTVSEQLYLYLFGVNSHANVKPLIPLPVVQTGRSNKTLLALPDVLLLNSKLPKRAQRWTLTHMLDSRSQNWETLKQAIYGKGQTIIVIQDANGDIFGMYGSQKWFPSEGFFGNDECFLFTLKPDVNIYEGSGRDNNFQLFTESGIGMGGTAESLGLFIQNNAVNGSTSLACGTFREFWPPARQLQFKITQMEIWVADRDEARVVVGQDTEKLVCLPYVRMDDDKTENETRKLKYTQQQPRAVPVPTVNDPPEKPPLATPVPRRCFAECAMYSQPSPSYNEGRVCCSKRCVKKIKELSCPNDRSERRDRKARVQIAQHYPRQEQEKRQGHSKYPKVKMKRHHKHSRISCESHQKHGAAGFIHPSLAAEENERNARKAKEGKAESPSSITAKPNRTTTSKKRLSVEQTISEKTSSPTYTHAKTQVGDSRLMKRTCRSYKHENKCACVVKKTCACPSKHTPVASSSYHVSDRSEKTYTVRVNDNTHETTRAERVKINENRSIKIADSNMSSETDTQTNQQTVYFSQSHEQQYIPSESSTAVIMATDNSNSESKSEPPQALPTADKSEKKRVQPLSEPISKTNALLISNSASSAKSSIKGHEGEDKKSEVRDRSDDKQNTLPSSKKTMDENTKVSSQDSMQAEMDCRCSSSSDSGPVRIKTCDIDASCCCETKVSSYLEKMNLTDIAGVPLSEVSSSMCSCILDNKNNMSSSIGPSENSRKKETQNLTKSRRKSDASMRFVPAPNKIDEDATMSINISPQSLSAPKKETQLHTKSRKTSKVSSSFRSEGSSQPMPPTCLQCKTLVGQYGCQCEAKSTRSDNKANPLQTSGLVQKVPEKSQLAGGNRRSVVIDDEAKSFISEESKNDYLEGRSISISISSSRNIDRPSIQSSQIKQAEKKACKNSCKCSLSHSYFPIFPEDMIKDETLEGCDCASYDNLRFPVIVETPPELSSEARESRATLKADQVDETEQKEVEKEQETKNKTCGCDDNDNTIIILNVAKCSTAETVEKIVRELEVKTDDGSNPAVKSLVFKCKDVENRPNTLQYSPCSSKPEIEREALRQRIKEILKRKSQVAASDQEEQHREI